VSRTGPDPAQVLQEATAAARPSRPGRRIPPRPPPGPQLLGHGTRNVRSSSSTPRACRTRSFAYTAGRRALRAGL